MTFDQGAAFALMGGAVMLFIWGRLRYDLVALTALVLGVIIGVIPAEEMFSGFSNDLIWIIASVFLLSAAIARSGLVERALSPVLGLLTNLRLQIPAFSGVVMVLSMITKNIGALAIMMPLAIQTARRTATPPSRLLMPMSFASLLGGLVTLVGTSPNVIVSGVRESLLGAPYALFDFAAVGLGVCLAGFAFLAVAPLFIRIERPPPVSIAAALEDAKYVTELSIPEGSKWIGKPFSELDALSTEATDILSVVADARSGSPDPDRPLQMNDRILVEGEQAELEKFAATASLILTGERHRGEAEKADEVRVIEGVIRQDSSLVGRSVSQNRLHERYGLSLLAVSREGSRIVSELRGVRLRGGDVVIFKADEGDAAEAFAELRVLPLSQRTILLGVKRFGFAPIALLVVALIAIALGSVPIPVGFATAAVGVLLLRGMSMTEAYNSIDVSLLVLLACLLPISESIDRTGGAALLAAPLAELLAPLPPFFGVGALILVGMGVTPFLNNAATVLIIAPIAGAIARDLNVNPDAYLMAVAIGAACDFLTPIGHQCNTLVMGPGGYHFSDYWRLGLPLSIIVLAVATPLIMFFWPPNPI
jgi:di/tricarboxylate transporter